GHSVGANTFSLTVSPFAIDVGSVLQIGGNLSITRSPDGSLSLAIAGGSVAISSGSTQVFAIDGNVTFTIDPTNGFQMQSFAVTGFSILGASLTPNNSAVPTMFPTAELAAPYNGQIVYQSCAGFTTPCTTSNLTSINVTFNDVDGLTPNVPTSVPFTILQNGNTISTLTVQGSPKLVSQSAPVTNNGVTTGGSVTYQYTLTGFPGTPGLYTVQFLPGAFSVGTGNNVVQDVGSVANFSVVASSTSSPAPVASLSNPSSSQPVTAGTLNTGGYIDVTYRSLDGSPINQTLLMGVSENLSGTTVSVTPFKLSGTGLDGVQLDANGFAVLTQAPTSTSQSSSTDTSVTLRYYFANKDSTGATPLFQDGTVTLSFPASAFSDAKASSLAGMQTFTISDSGSGAASTPKTISLGPLSLQGPTIGIEDIGFKNGMLAITISVGVSKAGLNFGGTSGGASQSTSGVAVNLTGVTGTFTLEVDALGLLSGKFRLDLPGNFSLNVASLTVSVPNVVNVMAQGIAIAYDPQGGSHQKLVVVQSASISFPSFNLTGRIYPFNPTTGQSVTTTPTSTTGLIPGLTIYEDGFALGQAELDYGISTSSPANNQGSPSSISFGSLLSFKDLRVGVQNFAMTFGTSLTFNGSIYFASGGATFLPGQTISATISALPGAQPVNGIPPEAMRATLTFSGGKVSSFSFYVAQMQVQLGSYLTLTATGFNLDTGAGPTQPIVSFASVGAVVKVGSLQITDSASQFEFLGDGSFETLPGFGVSLSVGSATGGSFQWPSFLPIQINSIAINWPNNITTDPGDFILTLSASVSGIQGLGGVEVSGAVNGIQIQPSLLAEGQFPIIGIQSFGVTVTGEMFGGELNAGLVGGILQLDNGYNIIAPGATTAVAHRILYLGIEGGFSIAGLAGFDIRLGLSQLGPLDVFIDAQVPGGILLDPDTGLTLNNFAGGVQFYSTLPSIDDPLQLNNPAFNLPTQLTAAQWLASLQQQVASQAKATNGQANFFSAFTSPMIITGSAEIYSIYTSQALFNGVVTIMISTDGKFLISGTLNFANNNISIVGKLYADLSQVSTGKVTVLFLAEVPAQVQLLTLYGKLQMGFENSSGQPVTFDVAQPSSSPAAATTAPGETLADPTTGGGSVDVNVANGQTADGTGAPSTALTASTATRSYIDVSFKAATGANLDYQYIVNYVLGNGVTPKGDYMTVTGLGGGLTGTVAASQISEPIPMQTISLPEGGSLTVPIELDTTNHVVWRYGPSTETLLTVGATGTNSSDYSANPDAAQIAKLISDAVAAGGSHSFLDMQVTTQTVGGNVVDVVTDLARQTVLAASSFSGGITDPQLYADALSDLGVTEFRYLLPNGVSYEPGMVQVSLAAGAIKNADTTDSSGNATTGASSGLYQAQFTVNGPTATIVNPQQGGTIDVNLINDVNWIDVVFVEPTNGMRIDPNSITSGTPKFTLGGPGLGSLALDSSQAPTLLVPTANQNDIPGYLNTATQLTYRFWLTGAAATSGDITLQFLANSWSYYLATAPTIAPVSIGEGTNGGTASSTSSPQGQNVVNITIPDSSTNPMGGVPAGFTLNSSSLDITKVTFTCATTCTNWSVTIDTNRQAVYLGNNVFQVPINVVIPVNPSATSLMFDVTLTPTAVSYFDGNGQPAGASAYPSGDPTNAALTTSDFPGSRTYLDVQFTATSGQNLYGTIGDNVFTLSGAGASGITGLDTRNGNNPIVFLGNGLYRFLFQGTFTPGQVTVSFNAGTWFSTSPRGPPTTYTIPNLASTETFTVNGATAQLVNTIPGTNGAPSTVVS
ncbi:MAG: hypothetical protein WAK93_10520, partial [Solirubrobacteraceae bacterium]